jgi:hypothetical protein
MKIEVIDRPLTPARRLPEPDPVEIAWRMANVAIALDALATARRELEAVIHHAIRWSDER